MSRPACRVRALGLRNPTGPNMAATLLFWRRIDIEGLERLEMTFGPDGISATPTVLCLEEGGFCLDHHWRLDPDWRARSVVIERWNREGHGVLRLERAGTVWRVNGEPRPDLDGTEEPDLSVSPFCNTFPIRRTPVAVWRSLTLDTVFIHRRPGADRGLVQPTLRPPGPRTAAVCGPACPWASNPTSWSTRPAWRCATSTCSNGSHPPPDRPRALGSARRPQGRPRA